MAPGKRHTAEQIEVMAGNGKSRRRLESVAGD